MKSKLSLKIWDSNLSFCFFSVNEALDDILADSDDEEEEQAIVNQVLDEIGIEITNKVIIFGTLYQLLRSFKIAYM